MLNNFATENSPIDHCFEKKKLFQEIIKHCLNKTKSVQLCEQLCDVFT